jgi:ABC-type Fe3+/spermidine/putrescine transport system ATPase subunit
MPTLEVVDVHKSFGDTHALRGVSFDVTQGEIVAVLGPSGCGKSTVLAVIAGLESPDRGEVRWQGERLGDTPTHRRGFGLMFQDFALFPHMDVVDNVAFGLRMTNTSPAQTQSRVREVLELVGLSEFGDRDVNTLSGGERQRVALARSLAPKPRLLMLDEPLGSLDRALRERLMFELRAILTRMEQTALYVTHDQEEAFAVADRVVLMNAGRVEQIGEPQALYRRPNSPFTARFLGLTNLLEGEGRQVDGRPILATAIGDLPLDEPVDGEVIALIHPDSVMLGKNGACLLEGTVRERSFRGAFYRGLVEVEGVTLTFDFPPNAPLPDAGERVEISFDPQEALLIYPPVEEGDPPPTHQVDSSPESRAASP